MAESDAHNVKQDMKIEYLEERVIKNEEIISQLATGQIAMQQSMTEINTTLNMLLKMGKPALLLLCGVLGALGIDMTGVVA
ncbi:MAG: hypothetical protein K0U52_10815 [Gammaproteobacteria bacterium]|nr:hypothetical protein [Gammaproteobacteria bacterium]